LWVLKTCEPISNLSARGYVTEVPESQERAMSTVDTLARRYRLDFGWAVVARGDQLAVRLDGEVSGVWMPLGVSAGLLVELGRRGLNCPIVGLPSLGQPDCVALVHAARCPSLPTGVHILRSGSHVPLPPSVTARGPVVWVSPPNRALGDLPSLTTLVNLATIVSTMDQTATSVRPFVAA
jgi:hypothetical protein